MSLTYDEKYEKNLFDTDLLSHIRRRENDEAIKMCLKEFNAYYSLRDDNGVSLLHFAAQYNNTEFAQHLIDKGANVNVQNFGGETPLMVAVDDRHEEMVRLLLNANADVFLLDANRECALYRVYCKSTVLKYIKRVFSEKVTPEYLENSRHLRHRTFHKDHPLYLFMPLRNAAVARFLIEKGSPVDAKDSHGRTALHIATRERDVETIKVLVEYRADVNVVDKSGKRPLNWIPRFDSCKHQVLKIVKILIDAGATLIDYENSEIVVESALTKGHRELIHLLLQHINIHFTDKHSMTPLRYILKNENPGVFEGLRGFDFDATVYWKNGESTFLHEAAKQCNPDAVEFFLQRGADVNAIDNRHRTPLCMAIDYLGIRDNERRLKCIDKLYENGADPQIITEDNVRYVTAFNHSHWSPTSEIDQSMKPILSLVALREASGQVTDRFMLNEIGSYMSFRNILLSCRQQLENMKKIKIDDRVTLFDFLIDNQVALYAQHKELILNLMRGMKESNLESYYHHRLQQRFLKLARLIAVNEVFVKFYNVSVIHIAAKIIDYSYSKISV